MGKPKLFILKSIEGFSLTEVMVGGAILAGIALAGVRMFKDQRQGQAKIDNEQDLISFHQTLTRFLQDENNCNATFRDSFNNGPASIGLPTTIYSCSSCNNPTINYDASAATTPRGQAFISTNSWIENTNGVTGRQRGLWMLTSFVWKKPPSLAGSAILTAVYEMRPNIAGSRATKFVQIKKDIPLSFRFAGGQFRECISPKASSINNLQVDICASMAQVSSTGSVIMEWNEATQSCVSKGRDGATAVKVCPDSNMVVEGIGADGVVKCVPVTKGVVPTDLLDGSNPGCEPNATVKIIFDGTNFRTVCD